MTIETLKTRRESTLIRVRDLAAKAEAAGRGFHPAEQNQIDTDLAEVKHLDRQIESFTRLAATKAETDAILNDSAALNGPGFKSGGTRSTGVKVSPLGQNFLNALYGPPIGDASGIRTDWLSNAEKGRLHLDKDGYVIARSEDRDRLRKSLETSGRRIATLYTPEGHLVFRLPESGTPILAAAQRVEIGMDQDYKFTRQTSRDPLAAGFVAPGTAKPSIPFAFETVRDRYRTVAVLSDPLNTQDLADIPGLHLSVGDELARRVLRRIEWAIIHGDSEVQDGPAGNDVPDGILHTTGVREQEYVSNPLTTIRHALGALEVDGYRASAIMLNPADYTVIELAQDTAGNPIFANRYQNRGEPKLFGVEVRVSPLIPAGQAIVGDWQTALVAVREDVQLSWSDAGEDFTHNTVRFRGEARIGFNLLYPAAFAVAELTDDEG